MAVIPARELFIDGTWVAPSTGRYLDVVNPATEEVIGRIAAGAAPDVNAAVAAATAAHKRGSWGKLTGKQRAETLRAIAQKVGARPRCRRDALAAWGPA
jgi:acyl-CoA reductase-like NAD-dependent aldehyde dehydrogenase